MRRYLNLLLIGPVVVGLVACSQQATPDRGRQSQETEPQAPAPQPSPQASPSEPEADASPETPPPPPLDVDPSLSKAINALGVDIYGQLRSQPGNFSISPMSISLALAMTYGGARAKTSEQMAKVLHFDMAADDLHDSAERLLKSVNAGDGGGGVLTIADRLYGDRTYTFEEPFLALTRDRYRAELERVDFQGAAEQSRAQINGWVSEQTKSRIEEIMPPASVDEDTRLVLVNAMYFKGRWANPFPEKATSPGTFHLSASESAEVPLMHLTKELRHGQRDGVNVLELAYDGQDLAMTILLPSETDGLGALEASLTAERISELRDGLSSARVELTLPRFTIESPEPISLNKTLTNLGMELAFSRNRADFTGMANPPNPADRLYIGNVFHRTFVEVTEEGTEAAAATAVQMQVRGMAAPPVQFVANHPFLFLIHTRSTGALLFIGRVADPRPSGAS